jgi:hypothetical protein
MNAYIALLKLSNNDDVLEDVKFIVSEFFADTDERAILMAKSHASNPEKWGPNWVTCVVVKVWNINYEINVP